MTNTNELIPELKRRIIDTLHLAHVQPSDIGDDDHLIEGGFGIDSIDTLELIVMIEQTYAVSIVSREVGEKVFSSVRELAGHINSNRPKR